MRDEAVDGDIANDGGGGARPDRPIAAIKLIGGHVALDLVNTVDWRGRAMPVDYLVDFAALVDWMRHTGLVGASEVRTLRRRAAAMPARAAALLRTVVELREAAHRLFRAGAVSTSGQRDDLAIVNSVLSRYPEKGEIVATGGAYGRRSAARAEPLTQTVERLGEAVAALLTAPELQRVRLCEGTDCGWLFLDMSPNHGRRWCAMESCGNRAKARRHYERRRAERR